MYIACVDDSKEILSQLEELLTIYGKKNHIAFDCDCYDDVQSFLNGAEKKEYSVVFMDIYFDGQELTGIDAARKLRQKDPECMIIFLTTSSEHMPEAFAVHAFSYILKDDLDCQLQIVLDDAIKVLPVMRNLSIRQGAQEFVIPHHQIICVYAEGHYLNIRILNSEPLRVRMTFRELIDELGEEEYFLQINKGVLVNMDYILNIEEGNCGMTDGTWLPVRRRDRNALFTTWRSYQFNKLREEQS